MGARDAGGHAGGMRCLVIDDNVSFLMAMRYLLERDGVEVLGMASTGGEAVECAGRLRPDVILLDVRLGNESGFDIAERLKATADWRPAIILVSTHAEDELAGRMPADRSLGFLEKTQVSVPRIRELSSALRGRG